MVSPTRQQRRAAFPDVHDRGSAGGCPGQAPAAVRGDRASGGGPLAHGALAGQLRRPAAAGGDRAPGAGRTQRGAARRLEAARRGAQEGDEELMLRRAVLALLATLTLAAAAQDFPSRPVKLV